MITIRETTAENYPQINDFQTEEWHAWDLTHYGRLIQDYGYKEFCLYAQDGDQVIGVFEGIFEQGVLFISNIIVLRNFQGQGIGKRLIDEAISLGAKYPIHKVMLFTGVDWEANRFYQDLGFIQEGMLKNHFFHHDFFIYVKYLE